MCSYLPFSREHDKFASLLNIRGDLSQPFGNPRSEKDQKSMRKKRDLGILSDTFWMLLFLCPSAADDDNRRVTKSGGGTYDLYVVAPILCTGLCSAVLFHVNVNHVWSLWRLQLLLLTLFFLPTHTPSSFPCLSFSSILTLRQEREQALWLLPLAGLAPLLVHDDNN